MALPKISVDDRTYDGLLRVLRKQIPGEAWSDHNPSDPGIMLLELLVWLGEMALYRMDRVPESHRTNFLQLLIDPPEPATVEVALGLAGVTDTINTDDVPIPAGTRLATDFAPDPISGRQTRHVFETLTSALLIAPRPDAAAKETQVIVTARETTVIKHEVLGTSDGTANQEFRLNPQREALGLPPDHPVPVLLDFVNALGLGGYQPNPVVTVDGVEWELKQFLLTDESRSYVAGDKPHFMVEPYDNTARFGDDRFGSIPPAGTEIRCARYQILRGPQAMIRKGALTQVLDPPALLPGERLEIRSHTDAQGGFNFFAPETRTASGLQRYHRRFRLVTEEDFRAVLMEDFMEYQALLGAEEVILRVVVLMNRKPPLSNNVAAPGHVTLLILADDRARFPEGLDALLRDTGASLDRKESAVKLSDDLRERIEKFLDRRRLITTQLHCLYDQGYEDPILVPITATLHVVVDRDRDTGVMQTKINQLLQDFVHALSGGFDGVGWPLGQDVHRSRIFRLVEELDGVDHVVSLTLAPAAPNGDVLIGPLSLPVLQTAAVTVERA